MKALVAVLVILASTSAASAFVCGAGPYRAGCVGGGGYYHHPHYGVYSSVYGPHAVHRWVYGAHRGAYWRR